MHVARKAIQFLGKSRNKENFRSSKDKLQIFGDTANSAAIRHEWEKELKRNHLDNWSTLYVSQRIAQGCSFCIFYFRPIFLPQLFKRATHFFGNVYLCHLDIMNTCCDTA